MVKEKTVQDADLTIKNYFTYRPTFLNKLVRISPLITSKMVDYFIEHRKEPRAGFTLAAIHFFIVTFLEPLSYFYLMLKGFNSRLLLTMRIVIPTLKTKLGERRPRVTS